VVVASEGGTKVRVLAASGTVERTMTAASSAGYGTAPALGDLDGDEVPEIVVQTEGALDVWKGDGTTFPGWPKTWSGRWLGNSAPVIGDVDGDTLPDIAITTQVAGSCCDGDVRLYNRNGVMHSRFPKEPVIGSGGAPAIADVDLDGRNELVVLGSAWDGHTGLYDKVWVYDLHGATYGGIEWGQFGGGPQHLNHYGELPPPPPHPHRHLHRHRHLLRRHLHRRHLHRRHRRHLRRLRRHLRYLRHRRAHLSHHRRLVGVWCRE
jgi:hypothetical protein